MEQAKEIAMSEAISAGADPETLVIVDIEDVPLAYMPWECNPYSCESSW